MSDYMNDHARGCQGREYVCTCGYDEERDRRIEALQAELAKAREALEPFAKYAGDLGIQKQRFFLQLLVCPEGDDHPQNYGPHFQRARAALQQKEREA